MLYETNRIIITWTGLFMCIMHVKMKHTHTHTHLELVWLTKMLPSVLPAMADLFPSGGQVSPVPEGHSGPDQLAVPGLHGGGYPPQLRHHLDDRQTGPAHHGTNRLRSNSLFCLGRFLTEWMTRKYPSSSHDKSCYNTLNAKERCFLSYLL